MEARKSYTRCCVEISGVVRNFGDGEGLCEITVFGAGIRRSVLTDPYRIPPGGTATFETSFFEGGFGEWEVEVQSPKPEDECTRGPVDEDCKDQSSRPSRSSLARVLGGGGPILGASVHFLRMLARFDS
jgi:hypothetical protein